MQYRQKISAITVAAYESILLFAQLINETFTETTDNNFVTEKLRDGASLVQLALNRTFHVPTGNVYITSGGQRYPAVLVRQFDIVSSNFEAVLMFDAMSNQFSTPFPRNFTWFQGYPPKSVPLCGFSGENPACFQRNQTQVLAGSLSTLMMVVLGCVIGLLMCG
ncbi:hypothetical protein RvY_10948-1 [Ramazzottius varieornatus]|uniref:Receptor ligand binding region domain-containing protein n=1 Tax=Ramazzottius varieornatus TaxID=947166 RepID=A0A1D1VEG0_RAMVA|nr:hypothetical protein RvY_10948-1 [Ramazzottius varieornatus]